MATGTGLSLAGGCGQCWNATTTTVAGKPACEYDDAAARVALVDALAVDGHGCLGVLAGRVLAARVTQVSAFLRGWVGYFRYGNSTLVFDEMQSYALHRLAIFIGNRHKRTRAWGWRVVAYASPDHFGLLDLDGAVIAPRPNRPWRSPNAAGEGRR